MGVNRFYLQPRQTLLDRIASAQEKIASYQSADRDAETIDKRSKAWVTRTLGSDPETVDHAVRTRLNRLAEIVGLSGPSTGTSAAVLRHSPMKSQMPSAGIWATLRAEPDFHEVEAWVKGEGTWRQVLELIDRVDAEPWSHRMQSLRLEPKGDTDRVAVSLNVITLFILGRSPGELVDAPYDLQRLSSSAISASPSPFLMPVVAVAPPPPPSTAQASADPPPPPPPPPPFPWREWSVTGVARAAGEPEVWLRNAKSGETRRLVLGSRLGEAQLVEIDGDGAHFVLESRKFRVEVGRNLSEGTPIGRSG